MEYPSSNFYKGLIVITHGLGGSTRRFGLRRIARRLSKDGFAVLKLNLRGAGSGRYLTNSNYSARCSNDIISVIKLVRNKLFLESKYTKFIKGNIPVYGIGLSLGGTILLNACLDYENRKPLLDGLACVSTPLDLLTCSSCIDKPRNYFYQKWLIKRLKNQILNSQFNLNEDSNLINRKLIKEIKTIKEFDEKLTAPSWGYKSVYDYYFKASPLFRIKKSFERLPPALFIHAKDDPWVPYESTLKLKKIFINSFSDISILITEKGGHNGFHSPLGCWSDEVVANWLNLNFKNKE